MTTQRQAVGAYGERAAARHLASYGFKILDRNWRCSDGELDLVAREGDVIAFCEVKTRTSDTYGPPAAAVGHDKQRRLRHLAIRWLAEHEDVQAREIRFDVIEVMPQQRGATRIHLLRAAF